MSSALYNRDILRLASVLPHDDRLDNPQHSVEARSAICGSRIALDVDIDTSGAVAALAIRANACALGQASATLLRQNAIGETVAGFNQIRDGLSAYLAGKGEMPSKWPDLAKLAVALDYPARHAAILLPYDAILLAFGQKEQAA